MFLLIRAIVGRQDSVTGIPGLNDKYRAGGLPLYEQDSHHLSPLTAGRGGQEYPHEQKSPIP